jgi:membrane-associated phospholipid phosphatase
MKKITLAFIIIPLVFNAPEIRSQAMNDTLTVVPVADGADKGSKDGGSYIVPVSLLAYGWLKPVIPGIERLDDRVYERIRERHPDFRTSLDSYLQWAPSLSIYAMDLAGVKTRHGFRDHLLIDAGSILVAGGLGYAMRRIGRSFDVYNKGDSEFPSGHATNAFRGAEIVRQELRHTHPAWSYSGYVLASAVGVLRLYNGQHYLSDVIAGAGLGILSTKLTYWAHGRLKARMGSRQRH